VFLPLWLQKSWARWTSYGGGGYWINPGPGNKNHWFFGWQAQYGFTERFALGAELFHSTADVNEGSGKSGFNVGGILNFDEGHHLLFSAGRNFHGEKETLGYLAYQWTFGPAGTEEQKAAANLSLPAAGAAGLPYSIPL
jgi:hypothetical protein